MSGQEIDAYNAEFVKYEGTQNGTTVRALCDTIRTHNLTNADDKSKQIVLTNATAVDPATDSAEGTTSADIATLKSKINAGTRYTVSFGYTSTGLIKNIGFAEKK